MALEPISGTFSHPRSIPQASYVSQSKPAGQTETAAQASKTTGTAPASEPENPNEIKKPGRRSSPEECKTCKERKYKDGSDEANVSFKSAAHISPEMAASAVRAHENEHVSNAYAKAEKNEGKVVNASVSIHTAICPECGRTYVSGGTTNTTIQYKNEDNPYEQNQKGRDAAEFTGANNDFYF